MITVQALSAMITQVRELVSGLSDLEALAVLGGAAAENFYNLRHGSMPLPKAEIDRSFTRWCKQIEKEMNQTRE